MNMREWLVVQELRLVQQDLAEEYQEAAEKLPALQPVDFLAAKVAFHELRFRDVDKQLGAMRSWAGSTHAYNLDFRERVSTAVDAVYRELVRQDEQARFLAANLSFLFKK